MAFKTALELAQSRSLSLNSFTRVAMAPVTQDGFPSLAIGVFVSSNGLNSVLASDWQPIVPPVVVRDLSTAAPRTSGVDSVIASATLPDLSGRIAHSQTSFTGGVLFTPSGLARTGSTASRYLGLCLTNSKQTTDPTAEVILSAYSGHVQVHIPAQP